MTHAFHILKSSLTLFALSLTHATAADDDGIDFPDGSEESRKQFAIHHSRRDAQESTNQANFSASSVIHTIESDVKKAGQEVITIGKDVVHEVKDTGSDIAHGTKVIVEGILHQIEQDIGDGTAEKRVDTAFKATIALVEILNKFGPEISGVIMAVDPAAGAAIKGIFIALKAADPILNAGETLADKILEFAQREINKNQQSTVVTPSSHNTVTPDQTT